MGGLAAYWVASELYYARKITPRGVSTIAQYVELFGEPKVVHQLARDGKIYFMVFGRAPSLPILAMPSSPPSYVFDATGTLVDWCPDRGETQSGFNQRWSLAAAGRIDVGTFKREVGL